MAVKPDPTAAFTDMQWYMYHQRNVAFFAAFSDRKLSNDDLLHSTRAFVELTPQLSTGFLGALPGQPIPDAILRRLIHRESVATLDGFPERWVDTGARVFEDPALPLFRVRYAEASAPDAEGRVGFLIVQVSHALVEGADSALLTRSHSAAHPVSSGAKRTAPTVKAVATGLGAVLSALHLLAGNFYSPHPGPFRYAARAVPRRAITALAQQLGVRQRALFFALGMQTLFGVTGSDRKTLSATYSVIDDGGGTSRDSFMRMRMRFARFRTAGDFETFARAVDAALTQAESKENGFNDEMNAQGIRMHRWFYGLVPFAYRQRLFTFMPYDVVLGLIPPHRLGGSLTAGLIEPVYAGAALEGANACVVVPGRRLVTFNFYVQETLLPRVGTLDTLLADALRSATVHLAPANPQASQGPWPAR